MDSDSEGLVSVRQALSTLGVNSATQDNMWRILSGIKALLRDNADDAARLFGLEPIAFRNALKRPQVKMGSEVVSLERTPLEEHAARHGLVRSLYGWLFDVSTATWPWC